jgi:hypothetical protein
MKAKLLSVITLLWQMRLSAKRQASNFATGRGMTHAGWGAFAVPRATTSNFFTRAFPLLKVRLIIIPVQGHSFRVLNIV